MTFINEKNVILHFKKIMSYVKEFRRLFDFDVADFLQTRQGFGFQEKAVA
jgi:hypothetical protein